MSLRKIISLEIKKKGLSYYQISKDTGISAATIKRFDKDGQNITYDHLETLMAYLGVVSMVVPNMRPRFTCEDTNGELEDKDLTRSILDSEEHKYESIEPHHFGIESEPNVVTVESSIEDESSTSVEFGNGRKLTFTKEKKIRL